jgi:hypothetical protein
MRAYFHRMNMGQDLDTELARLHALARRLDAPVTVLGTRITIGIDNIVGLVPMVGDVAALMPSLYILWKAHRLGATPGGLALMIGNLAIDLLVGMVPVAGDIFDILWNANLRNVAILERNIARRGLRARTVSRPELAAP